MLSSGRVPVLSLFLSDELLKSNPPRPSFVVVCVAGAVRPRGFCPRPDVAGFVFWKSDPERPSVRPVEAVVVAVGPVFKFKENPVPVLVAGVDVKEGRERPVDEVVVVREKGAADPAGFPKFKVKADAVVVAGFCNPKVNPVAGFAPNMAPLPEAVVVVVAGAPKVPKGLAPVLLAGGFVPKENGAAAAVAGFRVVVAEPPNENPVVAICSLRAGKSAPEVP